MKIKSCDCGGKAEVHSWEIEEDAIKLWNELYADMPREKLEEEVI